MPNAKSLRRKLTKKVIKALGLDTVYLRINAVPGDQYDDYGEPIASPWEYASGAIRIVIERDKRDMNATDMGGLPDPKKEWLDFYCAGDIDIRYGDKVVYPANTNSIWVVDKVEPFMMNDVVVITECRAYRDVDNV